MKILYGVQATGNGHITRARAMNKAFQHKDAQVDYLFSGRAREDFFDMEAFGDWQCKSGLTFVHEAGEVKYIRTARKNNVLQLYKDIRNLDLSSYDVVLSDFEPIVAWAAKRQNKTCIGVGHQYAFNHAVPLRGESFFAQKIMKYFAPATYSLGLHWHHFDQAILPPIAETHVTCEPIDKQKIVVYLGFEEQEDVIDMLEPFSDYVFVYYGPFARYESHNHIQLKPLSREGFKRDLATSDGVICNAGFELSSEAIQLGKKLLVKPLKGQMEQLSNARALEELNCAMTMDQLDKDVLGRWLKDFDGKQVVYPNVAEAISDWILQGKWDDSSELIRSLWENTYAEELPVFNTLPKSIAA